jgi:hypothetical protein
MLQIACTAWKVGGPGSLMRVVHLPTSAAAA